MGIINVEGVGQVTIAGDTPTAEESQTIIQNQKQLTKDNLLNSKAEDDTESFLTSPAMGRLVLEAGLAIGATVMSGGMALPATAARIGMLSRPFLTQLAKSSLASGAGSATGAVAAQTFDPKDDIGKEIVRAATEGALAEAIGGPLFIGAGRGLSAGKKLVQQRLGDPAKFGRKVQLLEGAADAEKALVSKADEIMYGRSEAELIKKSGYKEITEGIEPDIKNVEEFLKDPNQISWLKTKGSTPEALLEQAKLVGTTRVKRRALKSGGFKKDYIGYGGLTPAVKSSNRSIAFLENIATMSILGGTKLTGQKLALEEIAQFMPYEKFQNLARFPGFQDDLGDLFFNSMKGSEDAFNKVKGMKFEVVKRVGGDSINRNPILNKQAIFKSAREIMEREAPGSQAKNLQSFAERLQIQGAPAQGINPTYKKTVGYIEDLFNTQYPTEKLTWAQGDQLLKNLNESYRLAEKTLTPTEKSIYNALRNSVNESLLDPTKVAFNGGLKGVSESTLKAVSRAKEFTRVGNTEIFNQDVMKKILKAGSLETNGTTDGIMNAIVTSGGPKAAENTLDLITKMNTKVSGTKFISDEVAEKMRNTLKGNFIRKILTKSETASAQFGNYINPNAMKKNIDEFSRQGKAIMGKDWKSFQDLTETLGFATGKIDKTGNLPGGIFIQMKQSGAMSQVGGNMLGIGGGYAAGAGSLTPAAAILLGPAAIAKVFTDPKFQKLLFKKPVELALAGPAKNTPLAAVQTYKQIIGRLIDLGELTEEDANRARAEADIWFEQNKGGVNDVGQPINTPPAQPASLPDVNPADFPVVNAGQINSSIGPSFGNMFPRDTTGNAIASRGTTQPVNNMRTGGIVSVFKEN